jgi:hypothetical protein
MVCVEVWRNCFFTLFWILVGFQHSVWLCWHSFASIPKIIGSNPSGGNELTFRYGLLLIARGSSTWALIEFACRLCYPGNTLLWVHRAARKGWVGTIQIPQYIFFMSSWAIFMYWDKSSIWSVHILWALHPPVVKYLGLAPCNQFCTRICRIML